MRERIPIVRGGHLHAAGGAPLCDVGSAEWIAWLQDPANKEFYYDGQGKAGGFIAEKKIYPTGNPYWRARPFKTAKLKARSLGPVAEAARIDAAALELMALELMALAMESLGYPRKGVE